MKCTSFEKKIVDFIKKNYRILFIFACTLIGIAIRLCGRSFISGDMSTYLLPWFDEIKSNGQWASLGEQTGDYNILYQTIIALGTYFTDRALYFYKFVSIVGDFALAISCGYIMTRVCNKTILGDDMFCILYSAILLLPTVIMDSSYWGQCDSLYVTFLVWTIYFLYVEKFYLAFILYGIAFAFKFQSIFLLPFILILYFAEKKFSIFNLLYTLIVFWLSGLGGFINGRSLLAPFDIYMNQTTMHPEVFYIIKSFWKLLCQEDDYDIMYKFAILFTCVLLGFALFFVLSRKITLNSFKDYILCATWTLWTVLIFLPNMHERYTYPVDILLLLLVFYNSKFAFVAFLEIITSIYTYGEYLFDVSSHETFFLMLEIILWFTFSYICYCSLSRKEEENKSQEM